MSLCLTVASGIVIYCWVVLAWKSHQVGWDFSVFYIAAHLPVSSLYNSDAFAQFWREHLQPIGVPHWAPYVRLSLFSLPLRPILHLPYYPALAVWLTGGLAAYSASAIMLIRRYHLPGALFIACAAFIPAMGGIITGTDIPIYLLASVMALLLLERGRERSAGCVFIACLCKFNLILLLPVMLIFQKCYRTLAVLALGAALVLAGSFSLTPFSAYTTAVAGAPQKAGGFFPVGFIGFSRAINQPWCYPALVVIVVFVSCWLFRILPLAESFSVAIVGTLLISPYITWYDSTLLVLPLIVIYARSGFEVRAGCIVILGALPLWLHGGGNNGPIGFMHVGVELLLLIYFSHAGFLSQRSGKRI